MPNFDKLFSQLNPAQRQAVEAIEGPVMVLAGPGSGKTQVVAMRIAQILRATQLGPTNILALTFTEAGVTTLRERLASIIGAPAYQVTIATFHGFANRIITMFPNVFIETRELTQMNELDRFLILEEILAASTEFTALRPLRKPELFVRDIARAISTCKQENVSPDRLSALINEEPPAGKLTKVQQQARANQQKRLQELTAVYRRYEVLLKERGFYDYEDTILMVIEALANDADVKAYFQERYQYILVDEYQDTNNAQNALVEKLADFFKNPNVFVVGDDKQAIYRFQGASVANMLHFQQRYPDMKIISLKENYRSTPEILASAQELISHNHHQLTEFLENIDSQLVATRPVGSLPTLTALPSAEVEGQYICQTLQQLHDQGIAWEEMAVLYRKNASVRSQRELCQKGGIPVAGVLTSNLMTEPIIQELMMVLRAVVNPLFSQSVVRTLRLLTSGVALVEVFKLNIEAAKNRQEVITLALSSTDELVRANAQKILDLNQLSQKLPLAELIERIFIDTQLSVQLRTRPTALAEIDLLGALVAQACEFSARNQSATLADFLSYLEAMQSHGVTVGVNRTIAQTTGVYISTVHGAKGLEFSVVIIAGCDERSWNTAKTRAIITLPASIVGLRHWEDDETEDERRLFYVGLTRARDRLLLTYPHNSGTGSALLPAQFVAELGSSVQATAAPVEQLSGQIEQRLLPYQPLDEEQLHQDELRYVREQIRAKPFTFSDWQAYQVCPRQYLLNRVLALPNLPAPALVYGSAVHRALELFFKEYRVRKNLPGEQTLLDFLKETVFGSVPYSARERIYEYGERVLRAYYQALSPTWSVPLYVEYSLEPHHVMLGDIWISGKYDRVDTLDRLGKTARVVDYKVTSSAKTRNEMLGLTKNSDGAIKKQLTFYALLAEQDKLLPFAIRDWLISFIDDKQTFKQESFEITHAETQALATEIQAIYQEILNRTEFRHTRADFDKGCEICQLFTGL